MVPEIDSFDEEALPIAVTPGRVERSAFYPYHRHLIKMQNIYCNTVIATCGKELGSLAQEYWQLENKVGYFDVACERIVEISGEKALALMEYLTPRNVSEIEVGKCWYGVVLDEAGGNLGDPVFVRRGENHFWLMLASNPILDYARAVRKSLGMTKSDVDIQDPNISTLQVQGPMSESVIRALFNESVANLNYYHWTETETLNGKIPFVVMATGYTGKRGFEISLLDNARAGEFYHMFREAGDPCGLVMTGPSDAHRTEAGMMSWNLDMGRDDTPFHTYSPFILRNILSLDFGRNLRLKGKDLSEISEETFKEARLKDADFMGKPVLADILSRGVHPALDQRLVGITAGKDMWLDDVPAREKGMWPVYVRKQRRHTLIGTSRTLAYSGALKKNIGFAMLDTDFAIPGTRIIIEPPSGKTRSALVVGYHRFREPEEKGAFSAA